MPNHLNAARSYRAYLAGIAVLILTACSPRYDWREVRSDQSGWVALFPDKPQTQTRAMTLEGRSLDMTMTIARVNEISFVLGYVTQKNSVPDTSTQSEGKSEPVLKGLLRDAMLRNIQATKQSEQDALIARVGQNRAALPAVAIEADGQVGGKAMHLSARFASFDINSKKEAIQIMVLGPQELMHRPVSQQAVETFLTSLKVE